MKTRAMIVALLFCSIAAQAQEWTYRMHHGDVLVYQEEYSRSISIIEYQARWSGTDYTLGDEADTVYIVPHRDWIPPYFVGLTGGCILDMRFQFVDSTGTVCQRGGYSFADIDLFPVYEPEADTLFLRNDEGGAGPDFVYDFRMFDTLVCGAQVRAMSFTRYRNDTLSYLTVSEIFGIVHYQVGYDEWSLSSAVIGNTKYGTDTRKFAVPAVCEGSTYQYQTDYYGGPGPNDPVYGTYKLSKTTLDGIDYLTPGKMLWHVGSDEPFRVVDGIAFTNTGAGDFMLDSAMSLGVRTRYGIIGDTGMVDYAGKSRRYIQTVPDWGVYRWVEGIGLVSHSVSSQWDGGSTTSLIYANICGEEYGTYVGIAETPVSIRMFDPPYPNPISHSSNVLFLRAKYPLFGTFHFTLYDAVGRKVYQTSAYAPSYVTVPVANVASGLYYLHITGNNVIQTFRILIR